VRGRGRDAPDLDRRPTLLAFDGAAEIGVVKLVPAPAVAELDVEPVSGPPGSVLLPPDKRAHADTLAGGTEAARVLARAQGVPRAGLAALGPAPVSAARELYCSFSSPRQ